MRFLIAAVALAALTACGDRTPPAEAPPPAAAVSTVPEEWRGQLTDSPVVARQYGPGEFQAHAPASVSASGDGIQITTNPALGAFSSTLELGVDAMVEKPKALRLTVQVDQGALQFVQTYAGFPAGYRMFTLDVAASAEPSTIYLPIDANGPPVLVIANASRDGASIGRVSNVELVTAP